MSLPVATTISGMDSMEVLDQNLAILRGFKMLSADGMQILRDQGKIQARNATGGTREESDECVR
jgi:hypothetical protein